MQDIALDALEKAMSDFPRDDPRHRIEHMGNFVIPRGEKALERALRLGVIPVPQAAFLLSNDQGGRDAGDVGLPLLARDASPDGGG